VPAISPLVPYIVFEDNHLLVCHKPEGMPVQSDETGDACLVDWAKNYLVTTYAKPGEAFMGLVHRLDRPVSGLVLLAKTSKALARLNKAVADRAITKRYLALVEQAPEPATGHLVDFLLKTPATNTSRRVGPKHPEGKRAELAYTTLPDATPGPKSSTLLAIDLHTGRHHQIRVQLSAKGWPIVGDVKYGAEPAGHASSIRLHAAYLALEHPVTKAKLELFIPPYWAPNATLPMVKF